MEETTRRPESRDWRVLVIDDDEDDFLLIEAWLDDSDRHDVQVEWASGFTTGLRRLIEDPFAVALVDYRLGAQSGVKLIEEAMRRGVRTPMIVMTGLESDEVDHEAMRVGAADFLRKDQADPETLERSIRYAMAHCRSTERTEKLLESKSAFIAQASHQLRTPLASISGYLDELIGEDPGPLTSLQRSFTSVMKRNSNRLGRIIDSLITYVSVESEAAGERELVDWCEVWNDSLEAMEPVASEKDVALEWERSGSPQMMGNMELVRQLGDNLLSNAVKYTPSGGTVMVRVWEEPGCVLAEVEDTGIGISDEEKERVFNSFYRTPNVAGEEVAGSGLGLSIVKAIVDSYQGEIGLRSRPGEGTTFRVSIPQAIDQPQGTDELQLLGEGAK